MNAFTLWLRHPHRRGKCDFISIYQEFLFYGRWMGSLKSMILSDTNLTEGEQKLNKQKKIFRVKWQQIRTLMISVCWSMLRVTVGIVESVLVWPRRGTCCLFVTSDDARSYESMDRWKSWRVVLICQTHRSTVFPSVTYLPTSKQTQDKILKYRVRFLISWCGVCFHLSLTVEHAVSLFQFLVHKDVNGNGGVRNVG